MTNSVTNAMIEAGRSVPMSFNGCALPDKDLIAVYLAMKAKEEAADTRKPMKITPAEPVKLEDEQGIYTTDQSPADEIEKRARAMFDEVEVRRMANPHMAPARWEDHRDEYMLKASAIRNGDEGMREALGKCRDKFLHYEQLHRLKCTAEGDEKADRNREMADMCETALAGTPNR